ncbi:hypothetical protein TD95_003212 [Thielaviopsis punctulata]|uniref:Ysc84 actin-binding domain-containing protein n=1 Tax=Thielaviopsis punctulata TaxID=72032 RepID=A0A0F4ZB36_9PEZI|nr:hypothetical protein TD95_003212 [Thielaviopsis punctulata]
MQRVSALLSWDRRKSQPPAKLASPPRPKPLNLGPNANGKFESQQFWPTALDQECDKAARILKSFCTDGYETPLHEIQPESTENPQDSSDETAEPSSPLHVTKRIPQRIIQNAAGIAVFTCMRSGLWMTGSGGSGILIARKADGTWSPPSALILHTPTLSFIIGVDVYDCVLIINNIAALESLTQPTTTLGEDVGLLGGPLVEFGASEDEIHWKDLGNTVFTYLKSRGKAQNVNLNGCILSERVNENVKFYEREVSVMDILAGKVAKYAEQTGPLFEVIKQAEGRIDYDARVIDRISTQPAPGDALIESPTTAAAPSEIPKTPRLAFGIPHPEDPDPYGLKALEMAGMEIREAGSRGRPTSSQFDGSSMKHYSRSSADMFSPRSNRGSLMSTKTGATYMTDMGTAATVATTAPSPAFSEDKHQSLERKPSEVDYTKIDFSSIRHLSGTHTLDSVPITESIAATTESDRQSSTSISSNPSTPPLEMNEDKYSEVDDNKSVIEHPVSDVEESDDEDNQCGEVSELSDDDEEFVDADDEDFDDLDDEEEPVVFEVVSAVKPVRAPQAQVVQAKGHMVTIAKRVPPPLPTRSPARMSRSSKSEMGDISMLKSPLRQSFNSDGEPQHVVASSNASMVSIGSPRRTSPQGGPRMIDVSHSRSQSRSLVVQQAEEIVSPKTDETVTPTLENSGAVYSLSVEPSTPKASMAPSLKSVTESDEESSDDQSFKSSGTQNASTVTVA